MNETDGESFWGIEDFQFSLGTCGRSIRTFMKSPTGFVSNIAGPLRAIRYGKMIKVVEKIRFGIME